MPTQDFFIKPQLLTSGHLSAPWDTRMYSTSFERSTNFLQHKILKEWFAACLRWFMLCQSSLILLHKMVFQPFWLHLTVALNKFNWSRNGKSEKKVQILMIHEMKSFIIQFFYLKLHHLFKNFFLKVVKINQTSFLFTSVKSQWHTTIFYFWRRLVWRPKKMFSNSFMIHDECVLVVKKNLRNIFRSMKKKWI